MNVYVCVNVYVYMYTYVCECVYVRVRKEYTSLESSSNQCHACIPPGLVGSVCPTKLLYSLVCTPWELHGQVQTSALIGHVQVSM